MSSVIAAVQARICESAVDIVAAKIDAKINPTKNGLSRVFAASINPFSGSKFSNPSNRTRATNPTSSIRTKNGVCQIKNHQAACFLSLSSPNVITLVTTCGCPATPMPPKKKAKAQRVKPNLVSSLDSKIVEKKLNS